jgi:hypothetical protein
MFKASSCCGHDSHEAKHLLVPMPKTPNNPGLILTANPCKDSKPVDAAASTSWLNATQQKDYFKNADCNLAGVLEQSATDVSVGYKGDIDASGRPPIRTPYWKNGLCPVNVHWHLGAEHRSTGEYDETFASKGPGGGRRLAANVRLGHRCKYYDSSNSKHTTEYNWQYCVGMKVGETYEVHWPHSAQGMCMTPYQYQSPFYDGVFCAGGEQVISLDPLTTYSTIGVQGQVFTIVNDESLYYPDLIKGMIVDGEMGKPANMASYTGSTTGTSRNHQVCSKFTPITWQVDRKCHAISASSFDKMCADMMMQADDMSSDLHAHGSRITVLSKHAANNHQRL